MARRPRKIEVLEYGEEPVVDHKGRSRPLYKPRSPRPRPPKRWRPGPVSKVLLGLYPGARLMFTVGIREGLPYAVLGMIALLLSVILATRFNLTLGTLRVLRIKQEVALFHAGALVFTVAVFELLRLGGTFEERTDKPRSARALAAFLVPAGLVTFGAPKLISLYPRLVEAVWFAAAVLFCGALPATVRCLFDFGRLFESRRAKAIGGVFAALLLGAAGAAIVGAEDARRTVASAAAAAGFEILPKLLG